MYRNVTILSRLSRLLVSICTSFVANESHVGVYDNIPLGLDTMEISQLIGQFVCHLGWFLAGVT